MLRLPGRSQGPAHPPPDAQERVQQRDKPTAPRLLGQSDHLGDDPLARPLAQTLTSHEQLAEDK
eukprot:9472767-Pyramimonas_sp.AAC.2